MFILATSLWGITEGINYEKRIESLKKLKKNMEIVQGDISFNKLPFSSSLQRIIDRNEGPYNIFYKKIVTNMETENQSTSTAWKNACEITKESLYELGFKEKDYLNLYDMSDSLQCSDEESINEAFNNYLVQLENQINISEKEKKNKIKIYRTFGIAVGVFVVIVVM